MLAITKPPLALPRCSQALWERCMADREVLLTKGVAPQVLRPRMLAQSPSGAPTGGSLFES